MEKKPTTLQPYIPEVPCVWISSLSSVLTASCTLISRSLCAPVCSSYSHHASRIIPSLAIPFSTFAGIMLMRPPVSLTEFQPSPGTITAPLAPSMKRGDVTRQGGSVWIPPTPCYHFQTTATHCESSRVVMPLSLLMAVCCSPACSPLHLSAGSGKLAAVFILTTSLLTFLLWHRFSVDDPPHTLAPGPPIPWAPTNFPSTPLGNLPLWPHLEMVSTGKNAILAI